jgi:hypothetical protein
MDLDPSQYGEADRRDVDPPLPVEIATWSAAGTLDCERTAGMVWSGPWCGRPSTLDQSC